MRTAGRADVGISPAAASSAGPTTWRTWSSTQDLSRSLNLRIRGSADARREGIEAVGEGAVVEGNIDVLGKTVDDPIDLRERGAALEGHRMTFRDGEEDMEDMTDPHILLEDGRRPAESIGSGLKNVLPVGGRERQEGVSHRRRPPVSSAFAIQAGMSAERSLANASGPIADSILATACGVALCLPRFHSAASARPAGSPANWSRRRLEVWIILTVVLPMRIGRLDALVWNTGSIGTWVLSPRRQAASAPWTWTVSPLFRAMAWTTSATPGRTLPTKRFLRGRTKTPRARRSIPPSAARRESVRSTAPREPKAAKREVVNGRPLGSLRMSFLMASATDMAGSLLFENIRVLPTIFKGASPLARVDGRQAA